MLNLVQNLRAQDPGNYNYLTVEVKTNGQLGVLLSLSQRREEADQYLDKFVHGLAKLPGEKIKIYNFGIEDLFDQINRGAPSLSTARELRPFTERMLTLMIQSADREEADYYELVMATWGLLNFLSPESRDYERARRYAQRALAMGGDNDPFLLTSYATACRQLGDSDEAARVESTIDSIMAQLTAQLPPTR